MNFINENRLLTYCTQKDLSENAKERIRHLLEGPLQWQQIADQAISEKIAPLIYHTLKEFRGANLVPDDIIHTLQQVYYQNLARNMHLFTELGRILEAFRNNHVDVMVLKGAALANTVYADIGLRSMLDMDLLVKEKDLPRSKEIMSSLNYEMSFNVPAENWYRKHHFHLPPFFHREKSIGVEIHWNIANKPFPVDIDRWWKRAVRTEWNNTDALIPAPEDILLHLCLHLHYNMYVIQILKRSIGDFSETLQYYEGTINWGLFEHEVNRCGLATTAYAMLYLVREFFAIGPSSSMPVSEDHIDMKFIHILEDKLLKSSDFPGPFIHYYAVDGIWNKLGTLLRVAFPEREVMGKRYSVSIASKKIYLYYCMRPMELFFKYWRDVFALVVRKKADRE